MLLKNRPVGLLTGFTLIELLISIAIVGLITTIAIANFMGSLQRQELRLIAETLASNIKRAQTMTLTGARLPDGRTARGGYGIFLQPFAGITSCGVVPPCAPGRPCYVLFAEKPFSGSPPPDLSTVNGLRDFTCGTDYQDISMVELPPQISMTVDGGVQYISFAPPRPITCFATSSGLGITTTTLGSPPETIFQCADVQPNQITIQFGRSGISYTRSVIIDQRTGEVSVQ